MKLIVEKLKQNNVFLIAMLYSIIVNSVLGIIRTCQDLITYLKEESLYEDDLFGMLFENIGHTFFLLVSSVLIIFSIFKQKKTCIIASILVLLLDGIIYYGVSDYHLSCFIIGIAFLILVKEKDWTRRENEELQKTMLVLGVMFLFNCILSVYYMIIYTVSNEGDIDVINTCISLVCLIISTSLMIYSWRKNCLVKARISMGFYIIGIICFAVAILGNFLYAGVILLYPEVVLGASLIKSKINDNLSSEQ